jgi:hypothetical protein
MIRSYFRANQPLKNVFKFMLMVGSTYIFLILVLYSNFLGVQLFTNSRTNSGMRLAVKG